MIIGFLLPDGAPYLGINRDCNHSTFSNHIVTKPGGVQTVLSLDVEDLEVDATPEDLMLSYVSGEKGKVPLATTFTTTVFYAEKIGQKHCPPEHRLGTCPVPHHQPGSRDPFECLTASIRRSFIEVKKYGFQ